ncbi:MAG: hypothetical protein AAGI51_14285 [Pseudomonadota bacterium]
MTAASAFARVGASALALAFLAACATDNPSAVSPASVSNPAYYAYECPALEIELRRIGLSIQDLSATFEDTEGRELSRLKGQYEALREAAALNGCLSALAATADLQRTGPNGEPALVAAMQLPGGPTPFEGESLSAYAPEVREAWCEVPWARSVDVSTGRTIYNPCREPRYFSR